MPLARAASGTVLARSLLSDNDMKTLLAATLLALAACAHAQRAEAPGVRAEQNDAPAISPWAEPPANVSIEEGPVSTQVPADSEQAP